MERRSPVAHSIKKHLATFTLFIATFSYTAPPLNLQAIVTAIHTSHGQERQRYQESLLHSLHKKSSLKPDYTDTLNALLLNNTLPFLTEHSQTLFRAITLFQHVEGFGDTFLNLLSHARSPHTASGFLYELEVAITAREQGERVIAFGRRYQSDTEQRNREIDVETQRHWFECKNINWQMLHKKEQEEHLKRQLLDEHLLAFERNQHAKKTKVFMLCSKQPIPDEWQEWLNGQAIEYCCTSDEESTSNNLSE